MEAESFSETLVPLYWTKVCHIPHISDFRFYMMWRN